MQATDEKQAPVDTLEHRQARAAELLRPALHASLFGGKVHIIEAHPRDVHPASRQPDIYYGHGAGWAQEEPTIAEIARQGRQAFSMDFAGDRQPDGRFVVGHTELGNPASLQHVSAKEVAKLKGQGMVVAQQQMRAATTLLGMITERSTDEPDSGRIDAILQSESAGHGLIAANAAPDKFRNIVLAFPGTLSGKRTGFIPGRLVKDMFTRRRHKPKPEDDFRYADRPGFIKSVHMQSRAPGFREDARALKYSDLTHMLHSLRQKPDAPGVTLVAGLDDGIFKLKDYLKHMVASTDIDRLIIVPGAHAISGRKDVLATILAQFPAMEAAKAAGRGVSTVLKPLRERIVLPEGISRRRAKQIYKLADEVDQRTVSVPSQR